MNYQPKVIRCRLKTGGKTVAEIREEYRGQGMTYRDFENMKRAFDTMDGLVVMLSVWDYDGGAFYHLHNFDPADTDRVMMGIYYFEQFHPVPRYKNDLEKFRADWNAGRYDPGCAIVFDPEQVEEIEVLCEEYKPPKPAERDAAGPDRRKRRKKKRGKRK